jgi:hypothetical protein
MTMTIIMAQGCVVTACRVFQLSYAQQNYIATTITTVAHSYACEGAGTFAIMAVTALMAGWCAAQSGIGSTS